jgi:hypothetical protein
LIVGRDVVERFDPIHIVKNDAVDFDQRDRRSGNGVRAADQDRDECDQCHDCCDAPEPERAGQASAVEIAVNVESHGSKTP